MTVKKAKPRKPALKAVPNKKTQDMQMLAYPPEFIQTFINILGKLPALPDGMVINDISQLQEQLAKGGREVTVTVEVPETPNA